MIAALTYIFNHKRYKEIKTAYNEATTTYKSALDVWLEHASLSITDKFEFKTCVADQLCHIQAIDAWIKAYNQIKRTASSGLIYFYSERGVKPVPSPKFDDYKAVYENTTQIRTYQRYYDTYRRLIENNREAVERYRANSFNNFTLDVVKAIALGEQRILAIANVLKTAHECEKKYKRAWNVFASDREFDKIPLNELETINENGFETKNHFLYLYEQNPHLTSLILGSEMLPIKSFSEEAIAQEEDITILLAASNGELPKVEIDSFKALVHLEPSKELKRAILDSVSYGERCNFVDTFTISEFYQLRKDFDLQGVSFDDGVSLVKNNIDAVKAFNRERGHEATTYIEDYLKAVTEGSDLSKYINEYKLQKEKRDDAKRIQRYYSKGFDALFGTLDLDTCPLSYVSNVINSEERIKAKHKELEEAERKRIEAERKRREEIRIRQEIENLRGCVSSWNQPSRSSVNCFSLYYYYPTTCDWDASEDEWNVRNLIWDFKANPNRPQSEIEIKRRHERSVSEVLPDLQRVLNRYFGTNKSQLTLVCIPSSKKIVTERRYKDLSEKLCNATGMSNGYNYVHVASEGEARHLGGVNQAQFSIDSSFFKGKYVILFDDVITSGASMERFKRLLESAGATVIAGLSIGKTKHDRQMNNPIDTI